MTDVDDSEPRAATHPNAIDGVETALFDGEAVLYSAATKSVHRLGPVAGAVWLMCDGTSSLEDITTELADVFGTPVADMGPAVDHAISELSRHGLLVGTMPPLYLRSDSDQRSADDGVPILTGDRDVDAPDGDDYVGQLVLRVGGATPLMVIVGFEEQGILERARTLFAAWIDDDTEVDRERVSLGLRTTPSPIGNLRALPHVVFGDVPLARRRTKDDVVRALAQVLGGIHFKRVRYDAVWTGLRVFSDGVAVVLTDLPRPLLLDDTTLVQADVHEVSCWSAIVEDDGHVVIPPPLPRLAWAAAGYEPRTEEWHRLRLAGFAVHAVDSIAGAVSQLATMQQSAAWFHFIGTYSDRREVVPVDDVPSARRAVKSLLSGFESR